MPENRHGNFGLRAFITFTGTACAFWILESQSSQPFLYLLYPWPVLVSSVVLLKYWRSAGNVYTITESKLMFNWLGAGGNLGARTGSASAVSFSHFLSAT